MAGAVTPVLLSVWLLGVISRAERVTFAGYKVLGVNVTELDQWIELQDFMENADKEIDVWKWPHHIGDRLVVLLDPDDQASWDKFCGLKQLDCSVLIDDVQKLVEQQADISQLNSLRRQRRSSQPDYNDLLHELDNIYPTWKQIEDWLLALDRAEPIVKVLDIGRTHENRTLYVAQITAAERMDEVPRMWIDGGIHSREWIAHTSVLFAMRSLIEGYYNESSELRPLVENMIWYIMPVVNPDGYVYSHTTNRFWRKNRSPPPEGVRDGYGNTSCIGVDLNRNFDIAWGEAGVSTNSCYSIYGGHEPESEMETRAITSFISARAHSVFGLLSVHSFGQMVLSRWAYVNDTPPDGPELMNLAREAAEAITNVHDYEFIYGISPRILYAYSGGFPDWAKSKANIKYSYSTELRDLGAFGFVLPKVHITPAGEEAFQGILTLARRVKDYGAAIIAQRLREQTTVKKSETETNGNPSQQITFGISYLFLICWSWKFYNAYVSL